ncbi:aspartic proteinase CDR1-like [Pistacia vera]|uniref:aspartic proteinase CDR1-like n=1 Tax=Pistacia vera TaxID=55513 RepID=UPI001263894A|nr:aspartic proteinase CDR1-like [Pistacia vera]
MSFLRLFFTLFLSVLCLSGIYLTEALKGSGFSFELIHRDSPKSPFYNLKETPFERLRNATRRSFKHANRFDRKSLSNLSAAGDQADIISDGGEYLMNISIGTPPFPILAIADTGSDLIWTQCKPCIFCYMQQAPLFDPQNSYTYKDVSCYSGQCASLESSVCLAWFGHDSCLYSVSYGDGSFSNGKLGTDTITVSSTNGSAVPLPNIVFGCGHNDLGTFDAKATGIVGLGGGDNSLISQMGDSIDGKFSYCLVPIVSSNNDSISSKINFGSNAVVSGSGVVSTPLVAKDPETYYLLTLKAISVGNKSIPFLGSSFGTTEGNIVIDSGTTLALMPQEFNSRLVLEVSKSIDAAPVQDPEGTFDLCYIADSNFEPPVITVHFSGADVKLSSLNTFVPVSEKVVCFTFKGVEGSAIYGNLVQANFLIGYDTQKQIVSFKPIDCANE